MKKVALFFALITTVLTAIPIRVWEKTYEGVPPVALKADSAENLYLLSCDYNTAVLSKFDNSGNFLWRQAHWGSCMPGKGSFLGSEYRLPPYAPKLEMSSDGIWVVGNSYVLKYSDGGKLLSAVSHETDRGPVSSMIYGNNIHLAVGGRLFKYDQSGSLIWKVDTGLRDQGATLGVDSKGFVYVAGVRGFKKYSSSGKAIFNLALPHVSVLVLDKQDNVYISSLPNGPRASIVNTKYSPSGELVWTRDYMMPMRQLQWPTFALVDKSENLILGVSGYITKSGLVKFDGSSGKCLWEKYYDQKSSLSDEGMIRGNTIYLVHPLSHGDNSAPAVGFYKINSNGEETFSDIINWSAHLAATDGHRNIYLSAYPNFSEDIKLVKYRDAK